MEVYCGFGAALRRRSSASWSRAPEAVSEGRTFLPAVKRMVLSDDLLRLAAVVGRIEAQRRP